MAYSIYGLQPFEVLLELVIKSPYEVFYSLNLWTTKVKQLDYTQHYSVHTKITDVVPPTNLQTEKHCFILQITCSKLVHH